MTFHSNQIKDVAAGVFHKAATLTTAGAGAVRGIAGSTVAAVGGCASAGIKAGSQAANCVTNKARALADLGEDAARAAIPNAKLRRTLFYTAAGVAACPLLSLAAIALVPTAMSSFGTVVVGVGTMHAPLAAGGVAATLQASSAVLVTAPALTVGAAAGATTAAFTD